jgi:hypothetical protein
MRRSNWWTPSIVPRGDDHDVYLVVDDLGRIGRVWMEADYEATDYETVVRDLLEGQYKNPMGIFAFNTVKGWSRDMSADIAAGRCDQQARDVPSGCRTSSIDITPSTARSSCCRCAWPDHDHGMRALRGLRVGLRGASGRPWEGPHACPCGAAGMPCPSCNTPAEGEAPRMPHGFKTKVDKDGWRH